MTKYLFKNFLQDKQIYARNRTYWQKWVTKIAALNGLELIHNYLNTSFRNGRMMYDGNPIYSALALSQNRALRIIQERPGSDGIPLSAWLKKTEFDGQDIMELTIDLQLTPQDRDKALELIKLWLNPETNTKEIQAKIDVIGTNPISSL